MPDLGIRSSGEHVKMNWVRNCCFFDAPEEISSSCDSFAQAYLKCASLLDACNALRL
jgi:hypothetical protein